jgi:uncharacterized protein with GYD domain
MARAALHIDWRDLRSVVFGFNRRTLVRYTQQGLSKIKESPSRLDAAGKAAEKEGGKIHGWCLTMGRYDAVLISEFPSR